MSKVALIGTDLQWDFCKGGAVEVTKTNDVIHYFNTIRKKLQPDIVVLIQDIHPRDHLSFVCNNPGTTLYDEYNGRTMLPAHCVEGTRGADFHPKLERDGTEIIIQKGKNKNLDSYSGFGSEGAVWGTASGEVELTSLKDELEKHGIQKVVIAGLAYDECVEYTAIDAAFLGYDTSVVIKGCRSRYSPYGGLLASESMGKAGVRLVHTYKDL